MWPADRPLIIGSRTSRLARAQTELVVGWLRQIHGDGLRIEVVARTTEGDQTQQANIPLHDLAGRGVFVKDLEAMLLERSADILVHSLKDVTTDLASGMTLVAIPHRADPRDVLVSRQGAGLDALPVGARVGTSSPRRTAQLAAKRADLRFDPIRGNVDTRLHKMEAGEYDAVVLAASGLLRLGLADRITEYLEPDICMPDPGQGALAVESRSNDSAVASLLAPIDHAPTRAAVTAERALLQVLGGGCSLPVGALGEIEGDSLALRAVVSSPDGGRCLRQSATGPVTDPTGLGERLAADLLAAGARDLLEVAPRV